MRHPQPSQRSCERPLPADAAATREPQPLPALSGEQLSELLRLLGRRHRRAEADCHRCDAQIPSACGRGGRHAGRLRLLGLARAVLDQAEVKDVLAGRRPVRKLFSASLSSNTSQRCRASSARRTTERAAATKAVIAASRPPHLGTTWGTGVKVVTQPRDAARWRPSPAQTRRRQRRGSGRSGRGRWFG